MRQTCLFMILLSLCLSSCLSKQEYSDEELQQLVDTRLEEQLSAYRKIKLKRCRERLIQEANLKVDSIIFAESQGQIMPNPLPKPQKPIIREIPDTRPIAPLFDSIRTNLAKNDTL